MSRLAAVFVMFAVSFGVLPGCTLLYEQNDSAGPEDPPPPHPPGTGSFQLTKTRSIAGELPVVGMDSDRQGGLWIAYRLQTGDYYSLADVRVVHLDPNGAKLAEFRYNDEYTTVSGLAFSGDALWLNYGSTGTGNNHIRKLDPATGARIGSFATEIGIVDLTVQNDALLLSNLWNEVISIDQANGGELWRAPITDFDDSTQRGIAAMADGKLWVASSASEPDHVARCEPPRGGPRHDHPARSAVEWHRGPPARLGWHRAAPGGE
ncbi:MAG: hypothetical protein IPQ07_32635 [Myxococcales bacterium]|nr:hypothetical protein [Myxococcales bacterium]